jgi:hypothetical protein
MAAVSALTCSSIRAVEILISVISVSLIAL